MDGAQDLNGMMGEMSERKERLIAALDVIQELWNVSQKQSF